MPFAQLLAKAMDINTLHKPILESLKQRIIKIREQQKPLPYLAIISFKNNSRNANLFVTQLKQTCDMVNILYKEYYNSDMISTDDFQDLIDTINNDNTIDGLYIQEPIPKNIIEHMETFNSIYPFKDVFGISNYSVGAVAHDSKHKLLCPYAAAIMHILDSISPAIKNRTTTMNALLIGFGVDLGKVLVFEMERRGLIVTIINKDMNSVPNMRNYVGMADIMICDNRNLDKNTSSGITNQIKKEWRKPNTIIIEMGENVFANVVGVLAITQLIENLLRSQEFMTDYERI